MLYLKGGRSDDVTFVPSVALPAGWKFGTALPVASASGDQVQFSPVSLTTLVDSPLIAGVHYRKMELSKPGETPVHVMDVLADSDADLEMKAEDLSAYEKLVRETGALFGARHYRQYHFLLTLSNQVGEHGLEHHESNDSVAAERTLLDPDLHMLYAALVPHEFAHSWNGKYRRPAESLMTRPGVTPSFFPETTIHGLSVAGACKLPGPRTISSSVRCRFVYHALSGASPSVFTASDGPGV